MVGILDFFFVVVFFVSIGIIGKLFFEGSLSAAISLMERRDKKRAEERRTSELLGGGYLPEKK